MFNLENKKECGAKAYYSGLNLGFREGKNTQMKKIIRDLLKERGFDALGDEELLQEKFLEIDDKAFSSIEEKEEAIIKNIDYCLTLYCVARGEGFRAHKPGTVVKVKVENDEVVVPIHFFLQKDGVVYPIYLEFATNSYTLKPGTNAYYPEDEKLYLTWLAGKEVLGDQNFMAGLLCFYPKKVKKQCFTEKYLMVMDYNLDFSLDNMMYNRVKALVNKKTGPEEIRCDNSKCRTCYFKNVCKLENTSNKDVEIVEEIKKSSGEVKFTKAQQEVIDFTNGEMRVIAGAGAGKTTCLVNRVINLLKNTNTKAYQTLFITFTIKGANEIREKLEYWKEKSGLKDDSNFTVETFNSFGQKLVQKYYERLGFEEEPYLIDDIIAYDILKELSNTGYRVMGLSFSDTVNFFSGRSELAKIYGAIQAYKEEKLSNPSLKTHESKAVCNLFKSEPLYLANNDAMGEFERLVNKYNEVLKEGCMIDYSDQIQLALQLLDMEDINKTLRYYKHIIVDEFQDTSRSNMAMVEKLYHAGNNTSLLVCGDDAQAIFGFRGVGPENMIGFKNYYPAAKDVFLVDNFRSTNQIVDIANRVIKINKNQIKKDLIAHKDGDAVEICKPNIGSNNIETIAERVMSMIDEGVALQDICVLMSTRAEMAMLRSKLYEKGIATVLSISERYIDDSSVIGAYELANFLADSSYLLGYLTYRVAQDLEYKFHIDKETFLKDAENVTVKVNGMNDVEMFEAYLAEVEALPQTEALVELITYFKDNFTKFSECKNYLYKMIHYQSEKSTEGDCKNYKAVNISTIHASKGREFDNVIISNEKIDTVIAGDVYGDNDVRPVFDEERIRLYYVAMTRAKKKLIIYQRNSLEDNKLNEFIPSYKKDEFKVVFSRKPIREKF